MAISTRRVLFPELGAIAACACADREALFEIEERTFVGQFEGSITTHIGAGRADASGHPIVPLNIVGYSTTSQIPGMGRTTLDFDFSRSVRSSRLRGNQPKVPFPGTQTMNLNILVTTEAFPGVVLQNRNLGSLVNRAAQAFPPPKGSVYSLTRAVELVDPKAPTKVLARLLRVNTEIVSTDMAPKQFHVGYGVYLLAPVEAFDRLQTTTDKETPVAFRLERGGRVTIEVEGGSGKPRRTVFERKLDAGEHRVTFDTRAFRSSRLYYRLSLDGARRTGRMPLVFRG